MDGVRDFWFFAQSLMYNRESIYFLGWIVWKRCNFIWSVLVEMGKSDKLVQAALNDSQYQAATPTPAPFSEACVVRWSCALSRLLEGGDRIWGDSGRRKEAGWWQMWSLSIIPQSWVRLDFFGVFTAKGLKSVWPTRKDLTEMSLPDKGAASEETLQKWGCGSQESGRVRLICMCYERALSLLNWNLWGAVRSCLYLDCNAFFVEFMES